MLFTVVFVPETSSPATNANSSSFAEVVENVGVRTVVDGALSPDAFASIANVPPPEACVMFSVTVTVAGEPCAPAAVIVMCPVYVPTARPVIETDAWSD
jgi:hypothetical protein